MTNPTTLLRGPFDGHPITDEDAEYPVQTLEMPEDPSRMAVYELNDDGHFVFLTVCESDR